VIDTTVPLAPAVGGKATRVLGVWQGSAVQQTAELLPPGVDLVAALHTVSATLLVSPRPLEQDVLLCGDRKAAKARAAELLERVPGLRCIDCGRLEQSRITEQITALLIGINIRYKTHAGLRITGLQGA
jgi:8-hydroxy-5-deazaflavin:NADPH oxidoreductase